MSRPPRNDCRFFPFYAYAGRWVRRSQSKEMPLVRYFLFTSVMLLSLLFVAERYLPKPADKVAADVDRSIIRIHSDHQWPAAVRIDTNVPMPQIVAPIVVASVASLPASIREANAGVPAMSPTTPSRLLDKPQRRAKHRVLRPSSSEVHRHVAYQSNSFPIAW